MFVISRQENITLQTGKSETDAALKKMSQKGKSANKSTSETGDELKQNTDAASKQYRIQGVM